MATTQNTYTGNGSLKNYTFSFPYLEETDIKVSLDGVVTTAYTLANATTISFTTAPNNGVAIRIYRDTAIDSAQATFFAGSAIRSQDLNDNNNQLLYSTQETVNRRLDKTGGTLTGDLVMDDSDIVFEGATDDAFETTLTVVDPTADRTITLPDQSGTVPVLASASNTQITATPAEINTLDGITASTAELNIMDGVTATTAELNTLDGVTASTAELNLLDGVTSTTAELNLLDGVTATTTELNFVGGVTSNVQTQLNNKQPLDAELTELATMPATTASSLADLTAAEVQILDGATVTTAELNILDGVTSTAAELNILDGVTATAAELNVLDGSTATTADLNKLNAVTSSAAELNILDGVTSNASELNVLDGITASTTELNQLDGKTISGTLTPANTNDIPTSSAINTFVSGLINALGGFVAIADELNFPNANPDPSDDAGTVVSISDAGGIVVDSSGNSTTGRTVGGSTVTITGFPTSLRSSTLVSGVGLQVQTTSTLNTYTYHKLIARETDVVQMSDDLNDFFARYRVGSSNPTTDLDSGDLFFNTGSGKMLVYDGTSSAWEEVQSIGNFSINTLSSSAGTGGGSATFNGTAYRFTLSEPPTFAQQLIVSINGVVQKPNSGTAQPSEGFAIDGADIIFSDPPATSSPFFIITMGSTVNIGTPSDNTVTAAKIVDGTITNAEISSSAAIAGTKIANDGIGPDQLANTAVTAGSYTLSSITVDAQGRITAASSGTAADPDIITEGNTSVEVVDTGSDGEVRLTTEGTRAMTIDSSQRVGIGTSPSNRLTIGDAGGVVVRLLDNTDAGFALLRSTSAGGLNFSADHGDSRADTAITFSLDGDSEKARIDSSGRLGLGTIAPGNYDHAGDNLVVHSTGESGITIASGTSSGGNIYFADGTTGSELYRGWITYSHNVDAMRFGTSGTERLRILAGGGLTFNGDTATANALGDYEEGTWTPVFEYYVGGTWLNATFTSSPTYSTGSYVKIGNLVYFSYYSGAFDINSGTNAAARIKGLPYTAYNSQSTYSGAFFYHTTCFSPAVNAAFVNIGTTHIYPVVNNATSQPDWNGSATTYLMISGAYRTA